MRMPLEARRDNGSNVTARCRLARSLRRSPAPLFEDGMRNAPRYPHRMHRLCAILCLTYATSERIWLEPK